VIERIKGGKEEGLGREGKTRKKYSKNGGNGEWRMKKKGIGRKGRGTKMDKEEGEKE
jgi:hypothetical protein